MRPDGGQETALHAHEACALNQPSVTRSQRASIPKSKDVLWKAEFGQAFFKNEVFEVFGPLATVVNEK